jgi:hypothetical protein
MKPGTIVMPCVEHLGVSARKRSDLRIATHRDESTAAYCEGLGAGQAGIHGMDVRVTNDQILGTRSSDRRAQSAGQGAGSDDSERRHPDELSPAVGATFHVHNSRLRSPERRRFLM